MTKKEERICDTENRALEKEEKICDTVNRTLKKLEAKRYVIIFNEQYYHSSGHNGHKNKARKRSRSPFARWR